MTRRECRLESYAGRFDKDRDPEIVRRILPGKSRKATVRKMLDDAAES